MGSDASSGLVGAAWEKLERLISKLHETHDDDLQQGLRLQIKSLAGELKAAGSIVPESFAHRQWVQLYHPEIAPPATYGIDVVTNEPSGTDGTQHVKAAPNTSLERKDELQSQEVKETVPTPANSTASIEEAENLLRRAKVSQMRGNKQEAFELIQQAAKAAPQSSAVLEALGDELAAQRKNAEAKAMYLRAHQADPKNVSAERKHAEMVFSTQVRTMDLTKYADSEIMASSKTAAILSLFLPGLGQFVLSETVKGICYMVAAVGGWVLATQLGMLHLFASVAGRTPKDVHPAAFVCAALAIMTHIVASVDASSRGKSLSKNKPQRPEPPANLPFE